MAIGGTAMHTTVGRPEIRRADVFPSFVGLVPQGWGDDLQLRHWDDDPLGL